MEAYAVVQTSGKQYRVQANDTIRVDHMEAEKGSVVKLEPVLAVSDGTKLTIGRPSVAGSSVSATVMDHTRGPKLISFKKKRRKGYSRKRGHRQELTVLKIQSIG